ncbi:MAG: DUF983 domain-containing protein [Asticcacaulis sp.]
MARDGVTLTQALSRGLRRRCPHCGEASSFRSYLKIVDVCPSCHTPLGLYPCDDGPAYLTILIVGHLVVGPTFLFPFIWQMPMQVVLPSLIAALAAMTLILLPFVKGMFLALLWYLGLRQAR